MGFCRNEKEGRISSGPGLSAWMQQTDTAQICKTRRAAGRLVHSGKADKTGFVPVLQYGRLKSRCLKEIRGILNKWLK